MSVGPGIIFRGRTFGGGRGVCRLLKCGPQTRPTNRGQAEILGKLDRSSSDPILMCAFVSFSSNHVEHLWFDSGALATSSVRG